MRLKSIKLAGFKSFVDPTEIPLPTNLTAIVGPNGCGKSNVIDAVRWVLGESSAKHLRGESMADVIFNGSRERKPVGQAWVELVFDNREGKLGGNYAAYDEIAVKRLVSRDGQSIYFLNSSRCRRKDITDIFLGTGLGPRSYAIIEQGMISRLIEAKPHELRVFIEEAAGISKYKERRRETELRMNRTRENLERLEDIREELERQLEKLDQQAKDATRYQNLKAEQRAREAELIAIRWRRFNKAMSRSDHGILEQESKLEKAYAKRIHAETQLEAKREGHQSLVGECEAAQSQYYELGAEIAQLEQKIEHILSQKTSLVEQIGRTQDSIDQFLAHNQKDQGRITEIETQLQTVQPLLQQAKTELAEASELADQAESARNQWQSRWDAYTQESASAREQAQLQQSALAHLESNVERFHQQLTRLEEETRDLSADKLEAEVVNLRVEMETCEAEVERLDDTLTEVGEAIEQERTDIAALSTQASEQTGSLQKMLGQLSALEALQKAALADHTPEFKRWADDAGINLSVPFVNALEVSSGWEMAVEEVLNHYLEAYICEPLDETGLKALARTPASLTLMEPVSEGISLPEMPHQEGVSGCPTLLDQVSHSAKFKDIVHYLSPSLALSNIYCAESLTDAMVQRVHLSHGQSLITADGFWVSRHWIRAFKQTSPQQGALARQKQIRVLQDDIEQAEFDVDHVEQQLKHKRTELSELERRRQSCFQDLNQANESLGKARSQVTTRTVRIEQIKARLERVTQEQSDLAGCIDTEQVKMAKARGLLEVALDQMAEYEQQKNALLTEKDETKSNLETTKQSQNRCREQTHELQVSTGALEQEFESLKTSVARSDQQIAQLSERKSSISKQIAQLADPEQLQPQLEQQLSERLSVEQNWTKLKQQLSELDESIQVLSDQKEAAQVEAESIRADLEQKRLKRQTEEVQIEILVKQAQETEVDVKQLAEEVSEDATEGAWEQKIKSLVVKAQDLGAINLAAIEDFKTQLERKTYLDAQFSDLTEALETLTQAINTIDEETRALFKHTFDRVNAGLEERFPAVFGGGSANLALTDDDLLEAGISIMARPPGKRNSTIHLLSGGEKALTAIALVFSIFQLNPAPFCMLDEVDAPLDDANVGRYSKMVSDMSKSIQFIYISHNKVAMEMAHQMMGVTMHEPGVSRVVSVDIDSFDPDVHSVQFAADSTDKVAVDTTAEKFKETFA